MLKLLTVALVAAVAYYSLRMLLAWKGEQQERDRLAALAVAKEQTQGAKYGMIGGVVAGVGGLVGGLLSFGGRR